MQIQNVNFTPFKGNIESKKIENSVNKSMEEQTEVCSKQMAAALAASRMPTSSPLVKMLQRQNVEIVEKGENAINKVETISKMAKEIYDSDNVIKENAENGSDIYKRLAANIAESGLNLSGTQYLKNKDGENIGIVKSENGKIVAVGIGVRPAENGGTKISHWYEDNSGALSYYNGAVMNDGKIVSADEKYEVLKFNNILRSYTKKPVYGDDGNLIRADEQRNYKYGELASYKEGVSKNAASSNFDFNENGDIDYSEELFGHNAVLTRKKYTVADGRVVKYEETADSKTKNKSDLTILIQDGKVKSAIVSEANNGSSAIFNEKKEFIFHDDGSEVLIGTGTGDDSEAKNCLHHVQFRLNK